MFQNSQKTKDGKLSSKAMTRGLIKKFFIICIVCVMKQLDDYLGINYLRNLFIVSFIINELTSLYENANSAGIINDDIKKLFDKVFTILRKDEN